MALVAHNSGMNLVTLIFCSWKVISKNEILV